MRKGISSILAVCLTVVIMLGVAAGGWYCLNNKWQNDKKTDNDRISALQKEIADLKKAASESAASEPNTNTGTGTATAESNLLTYTSAKYGYSFQYPKTFSLVDWMWNGQSSVRVPQSGKVVWVSKTALSERAIPMDADPISQYFSVSVSDQLCGLSQLSGDGITVSDVKFLTLNAWKTNVTDPSNMMGGQYETAYHVNKGNYCYNLTWVNSDAAGTHDSEVDAMVASFVLN